MRKSLLLLGSATVMAVTGPILAAPEYKDMNAVVKACRAAWKDQKAEENLMTCKQRSNDSGDIDVLGGCSSAKKKGIKTKKSGKCTLNLQLSCSMKNGNWKDTQVSCKTLIKSPKSISNSDGKIVEQN